MGLFCCYSDPIVKDGVLFSHYVSNLKSLDLVLFDGGDQVADLIKYVEKKTSRRTGWAGKYSHCGIVVKSDILDHPLVRPNKVYVFESTMSGKLTDGVLNVQGESFLGAQLRDLSEVVQAYDKPNSTKIAICHLKQDIRNSLPEPSVLSHQFTQLFNRLNGTRYDALPWNLLAAAFKCLRGCRNALDKEVPQQLQQWLFCSELVATVYKELGIFPEHIDPRDVMPTDFLPNTDKDNLPCVVSQLVQITTLEHYDLLNHPSTFGGMDWHTPISEAVDNSVR